MDDGQEQGNYEERLKQVFDRFDASGAGSLSPEELCELCQSLHLDDTTPVLQALLQNQDDLNARVPLLVSTEKLDEGCYTRYYHRSNLVRCSCV